MTVQPEADQPKAETGSKQWLPCIAELVCLEMKMIEPYAGARTV